MKKYFSLVITVIFFFSAAGQRRVDEYKGNEYGPGAIKVTTVSTDQKLNKIVTVEIIDKDSIVRVRTTWINDVEGKWSEETITYSPGEKIVCRSFSQLDKDKKLIRHEFHETGERKFVDVRAADGEMRSIDDGSIFPEAETHEKKLQEEIKEIEEKTIPSLEPGTTPCSQAPGGNCQSKGRIFLAYSYLSGLGEQAESFPLGMHASFVFNTSPRVALGLDASIHTKKIGEENLTRFFFLATGKYTFGNVNKCDRTVIPDLHVLAGLVCEKYGDSKGSGFAFGGGGGLDITLSKNIALSTQVDLVGIKFKQSDEMDAYLRASAGVALRLLRKGELTRRQVPRQ